MSSEGRSARASWTEMTELVLPQHANAVGTAFGGTVLSWIDICGAIAAHRHSGGVSVTAAIDELEFSEPIRVGDIVRITARLNAAFRTSMEVEVRVEREEPGGVGRRVRAAEAFVTYVHVGSDGRPVPVPALASEDEEDRVRQSAAEARRQQRLRKRSPRPPSP